MAPEMRKLLPSTHDSNPLTMSFSNLGSKVFFIWGGFCCVCTAFVYLCIYETKGLSLEQVDELYENVYKAWQSPGFVPTINFRDLRENSVEVVNGKRASRVVQEQATMAPKPTASVHEEHVTEKQDL
jgi:hypothetical protein